MTIWMLLACLGLAMGVDKEIPYVKVPLSIYLPAGETGPFTVQLRLDGPDRTVSPENERWSRMDLHGNKTSLQGLPEIHAPSRGKLMLLRGVEREIRVEAAGFWAPPLRFVAGEDPVEIQLYRTGWFRGTRGTTAGREPAVILAVFELFGAEASGETESLHGEALCIEDSEGFLCELPAGRLDVRLEGAGEKPRLYENVLLEAGETVAAGPLEASTNEGSFQ